MVFALKPVIEPDTDWVEVPARVVAMLAERSTVVEGVQGAETLAQESIALWFVPMKSFGVDARNLALMAPETDAVVDVTLLTAPVEASGIAVITAMPSPRLPNPRLWPTLAEESPKTLLVASQAVVTEAHDEPPPPPHT